MQGRILLPSPLSPTLSELFAAHPRDGGWMGFLLVQIDPAKPLLWVQERMAILESGRLHPPGLAQLGGGRARFGDDPGSDLALGGDVGGDRGGGDTRDRIPGSIPDIIPEIIHVEARDARDALWAMEEGLRCAGLSAVIGELWGDPRALDFTATRRLAVAAERSGVPCWLVRLGGQANLSGARMRWRIASAPSLPNSLDPRAPGTATWNAELFRARGHPPGQWTVRHEADRFHLVAGLGDRTLGAEQRLTA